MALDNIAVAVDRPKCHNETQPAIGEPGRNNEAHTSRVGSVTGSRLLFKVRLRYGPTLSTEGVLRSTYADRLEHRAASSNKYTGEIAFC